MVKGAPKIQLNSQLASQAMNQPVSSMKIKWPAPDMSLLMTSRKNVPILTKRTLESEDVLEQYTQQFQVGGRSLLDLLNAENELFQARSDLVDGRVQHEFAKYRVYNTLGSLLDVFGIAPAGSN